MAQNEIFHIFFFKKFPISQGSRDPRPVVFCSVKRNSKSLILKDYRFHREKKSKVTHLSMESAMEMHCKESYSIFKLYCKKFVLAPRSTVFSAADCNLQIFIWYFVIKNVCCTVLFWNQMFMLDDVV